MEIHNFWPWFYSVRSCQSFTNTTLAKKHNIRIKTKIKKELRFTNTFWNFFAMFFVRHRSLGRDVEQQVSTANRSVKDSGGGSDIKCSSLLAITSLWSRILYTHPKKGLPPASAKPKSSLDAGLWLQLSPMINITLILSACHKREAQSSLLQEQQGRKSSVPMCTWFLQKE